MINIQGERVGMSFTKLEDLERKDATGHAGSNGEVKSAQIFSVKLFNE